MAVRWVEVPLSPGLGGSYPNPGVTPRGLGKPGGQGVHREVESEGLEEEYQAVIDGGCAAMNRSAKDGTRSSLHYGGEGDLIHPSYQGVCGRHGMEDNQVTHGDLSSMVDTSQFAVDAEVQLCADVIVGHRIHGIVESDVMIGMCFAGAIIKIF